MKGPLDILRSASPFPICSGGLVTDGYKHDTPSVCRNCESKNCLSAQNELWTHQACDFGMSFYAADFHGEPFSVVGLIAADKNNKVGGERRKALKRNWVQDGDVQAFRACVKSLEESVREYGTLQTQTSLASLHEIRSSVSVVLSACDALIQEAPGGGPSEKIDNADPLLKSLFQANYLLREQLELADVIANPESITYGRRFISELNGCFYKMTKLYEAKASKRGVRIQFHGGQDFRISTYNSFQRVPMILLDNACKYSYANKTIYVTVAVHGDTATVRISSFGDIVPNSFREQIFEKFVRGPSASKQAAEGMGLGLYAARQIADAHGFSLHYEAKPTEQEDVGNNDFVLSMSRGSAARMTL